MVGEPAVRRSGLFVNDITEDYNFYLGILIALGALDAADENRGQEADGGTRDRPQYPV